MGTLPADSSEARRIDDALRQWRQGDLALDESWFVHMADPSAALSEAAAQADGNGVQAITSEVAGLVVVTQTCDIIRECSERPYIEVAPLVQVSEEHFPLVKLGVRPALATLPRLEQGRLAADLDRVMTVEKSVAAAWRRTLGYDQEADGRNFAKALARKRERCAFPDDFTEFADHLRIRLQKKHNKNTDEGRSLRALREIRVLAEPSWNSPRIAIFFWFIRNSDEADFEGMNWADLKKSWLKLVPASGRFQSVNGQVVALEDMTAADYCDSDQLDLDHLSRRTPGS